MSQQANYDFEEFKKTISDDDDINASFNVIDEKVLYEKYNESLSKVTSNIDYVFSVEKDKCMQMELNGIKTVLAIIPLKECVNIPGINTGALFRKNVRNSLGKNNKVNKGIAKTLKNDSGNFFFYHNGITAICKHIDLGENNLSIKDLNVVNGCQSLSTIYSCGEITKKSEGYILFKFYEITDNTNADNITNNTNSQSAVKAKDMRSNDKTVLRLKNAYEQMYTDGYFITKRGEEVNEMKYNPVHIIELTGLGKELIAWHSQRPNLSYGETKIFDIYFNQLFHKDYKPADMQALKEMFDAIIKKWNPANPLKLNETLLAMKAYAPYHHLYAISALVNEINNKKIDKVPSPSAIYKKLLSANILENILDLTASALNNAFEAANKKSIEAGRIFAPQNWIKSKSSVKDIDDMIMNQITAFKMINEGKKLIQQLSNNLMLNESDYSERYSAD